MGGRGSAGIEYDIARINELSGISPNICKVAPSATPEGLVYHIQDVHRSGGIHSILGSLVRGKPGLIKTDCLTVTGKTLGENIANYDVRSDAVTADAISLYVEGSKATGKSVDTVRSELFSAHGRAPERVHAAASSSDTPAEDSSGGVAVAANPCIEKTLMLDPFDCIREVERSYSDQGGLTILYGNLAEEGSVVKTAGVDPEMLVHSGPAIIFESQDEACEGILGGKVEPGMVVVIRYEGPRGGPGMQEMLSPTSYIKGMGLGKTVALITDGRFSGGTAGACIGHISPEAAEGGAIGLIENGDIIDVDIPAKTLNVKLSGEELAGRRANWQAPEPRLNYGWLGRYQKWVTNSAKGAVLKG